MCALHEVVNPGRRTNTQVNPRPLHIAQSTEGRNNQSTLPLHGRWPAESAPPAQGRGQLFLYTFTLHFYELLSEGGKDSSGFCYRLLLEIRDARLPQNREQFLCPSKLGNVDQVDDVRDRDLSESGRAATLFWWLCFQ